MDDEASVEQRCARIRGRMVWILSQLEGDGTALADMADLKSLAAVAPGSRGGTLDSQLRAQREAHERQMEEELQRQHRQLSSDHERELDEMRVRLTTQHVSEMNAMRSDLTAAREASRSASSTGQNAAREAKLDAEKQRGALEAQHRSELKEAQQKIAAAPFFLQKPLS